MITTKPYHVTSLVDIGKATSFDERIVRTKVVLDYNKGGQCIDPSHQLSAYYTCPRRSIKWYRKVAFELIFGMSIVNGYLIHKENYANDIITMLQFRESLVRSLLLGASYENLKPGSRASFLRQLSRYASDKRFDNATRYNLPSDLSGSNVKKCIKHYLFNHVRTSFLNITAEEMAIAI